MTKTELIEKITDLQKHRNLSKAATADIVESFFDNLSYAIKKAKRFSYPCFGTFNVRKRKGRKGINPKTGQILQIKSSKTVCFRVSKEIKSQLNMKEK